MFLQSERGLHVGFGLDHRFPASFRADLDSSHGRDFQPSQCDRSHFQLHC